MRGRGVGSRTCSSSITHIASSCWLCIPIGLVAIPISILLLLLLCHVCSCIRYILNKAHYTSS